MSLIDWSIVILLVIFLFAITVYAGKFAKSVANFLAGGRCAGRYVICVGEGAAGIGAITILGFFEMYYKGGFPMTWWYMLSFVAVIIMAMSGWVIYRYRSTRALTLGQFLGMRYGNKFRIYAGIICWVSGIINFGVFPSVGSRFFIYYCGFPSHINVFGLQLSVFIIIMLTLISVALILTLTGGQIVVLVADFFQGMFTNIVFVVIIVFLFFTFSWSDIASSLSMAPENESLIHPLKMSGAKDFNLQYFVITFFMYFYGALAWQGLSGYAVSAKTPHEGRMGKVIATWRIIPMFLFVLFIPICTHALMKCAGYATNAQSVNGLLSNIDNPYLADQLTVPLAISTILPVGLVGALCAVMLAAFISTCDSYLHSWGSLFIQDIVAPLRRKPLPKDQHMRWLRYSIIFVAIFIFFFSMFFKQADYIIMVLQITGAIWLGGAGSVIIGGLYWKRGTTAGAFTSITVGSILAVTGIITRQLNPDFALNGMTMTFYIALIAIFCYIAVSLLTCKKSFNMDKLLHRGEYADNDTADSSKPATGIKALLGISSEFTKGDKFIYYLTMGWSIVTAILFLTGTLLSVIFSWGTDIWLKYWRGYIVVMVAVSVIVTVWISVGGVIDLRKMFKYLRTAKEDEEDDGRI